MAVSLSVLYLACSPPAADLAAATYRSNLFARVGFTTWDTGWYAAHGHWLPAYSLLSPALGALLGVRPLLVLSALASTVLFGLIAERAFGRSAGRAAAIVFAFGFCVGMLSGRVPFDLGFAIALASVLATMRRQTALALALAVLTSVSSPVAGAFLALAGVARLNRAGIALAVAALLPIAVLSVAFPEGGYEPFAASAFWPALAGVLVFALLLPRGPLTPRAWRTLRLGAALYGLALAGAYVLSTPMGGNAARLGPLLAAPLLVGVLWERRRTALLALAPALIYWQIVTPLSDLASIGGDPSVHASYYAPLLAELRRLDGGAGSPPVPPDGSSAGSVRPARLDGKPGGRTTIVEVPLTRAHWEAAYLAGDSLPDGGRIALARGWERQLDTRYAPLFYRPTLTPAAYRSWLARNRVRYVALADVPLDGAGRLEGRLVARGLPYLRPIWRSKHWRLYRFIG